MKIFIRDVKIWEVSPTDEEKVLSYFLEAQLENGEKISIFDDEFKLVEYKGKWIEGILRIHPPPSWYNEWDIIEAELSGSPILLIQGTYLQSYDLSPDVEMNKFIFSSRKVLKKILKKSCSIQTENGSFIISCENSYVPNKSYEFPVYSISLTSWYPLNSTILNPKYDELIFKELKGLIYELRTVVKNAWEYNKVHQIKPLNKNFNVKGFISDIPEYNYVVDIHENISNHPFSDEMIDYVRMKFIYYTLNPRFYLKKENVRDLEKYMIDLVIHLLLKEMEKNSSLTLEDIQIESGKYP